MSDDLNLFMISSLIAVLGVALIYSYFYFIYRERYVGIWAASWCILLCRYVLFDFGLIEWQESLPGLMIYQIFLFSSAFLFLSGTYEFIGRAVRKKIFYSALMAICAVSFLIDLYTASLTHRLALPLLAGSCIGIWTGMQYIWGKSLNGIGHLIAGYSYIFWNLLNLTLPFTIHIETLAVIGYHLGGIFRLGIAFGTIVAYFEKNRAELINKEKDLNLFTENAADVIYAIQWKPFLQLKYVSSAIYRILGYEPAQFYKNMRLFFGIVHPDDRQKIKNYFRNIQAVTDTILTFRLIHRNGDTVWVEQKCVPILGEDGIPRELQGIIRDITARKELEAMTIAFDRVNMVGNMAATVAHEIRNPMATVHGYLQYLSRKSAYAHDKDKFDLMLSELDRANAIIGEYLSLSRQKPSFFQYRQLNPIIQTLSPLIKMDATNANVNFRLELRDEIPELYLDENEIRQLLLNLARNAIESMPRGGTLTITTAQTEQTISLSIRDTGCGIPANILLDIGTPFFTTKKNGTGLGLPICYQIAARHHAEIKIDTGKDGTTFHVIFPVAVKVAADEQKK